MKIPVTHRPTTANLDSAMTPLIDVVFLLLIFFICASIGQLREEVLPADLPSGDVQAAMSEETPRPTLGEVWVKLLVDGNQTKAEIEGTLYDDLMSAKDLLRSLSEAAPEIPVILDVAKNVPLGDVVTMYDTCRAAGFESIKFALDASAGGGN